MFAVFIHLDSLHAKEGSRENKKIMRACRKWPQNRKGIQDFDPGKVEEPVYFKS